MSALTIIITSEYSWGPQLIFWASFNTWTYCTDSPNYLVHLLLFGALLKILEVVLWPASHLVIYWAVHRSPTCPWNKQDADSAYSMQHHASVFCHSSDSSHKASRNFWTTFWWYTCLFSINANLFSSVSLISVTATCAVHDQTRPISCARQEFYTEGFPVT